MSDFDEILFVKADRVYNDNHVTKL